MKASGVRPTEYESSTAPRPSGGEERQVGYYYTCLPCLASPSQQHFGSHIRYGGLGRGEEASHLQRGTRLAQMPFNRSFGTREQVHTRTAAGTCVRNGEGQEETSYGQARVPKASISCPAL